ncbi:hypothetical protein M2138_000754 [Dysgonomonadaceae bacterium PH5-43]|nr:hypothetical protein [Dysgonomonadaceae bacterium PH5-43]
MKIKLFIISALMLITFSLQAQNYDFSEGVQNEGNVTYSIDECALPSDKYFNEFIRNEGVLRAPGRPEGNDGAIGNPAPVRDGVMLIVGLAIVYGAIKIKRRKTCKE